ncbi:secretion protein [Pigmentiphaga aceris]|uniref:Secretion protein n=1 Tax=Pigmentiphaga aceris TaxID=1940612 RepID=A0A5C0AYW4_9BURK|nr:pilus assembly protein N-terminal domain-containing protein [Pigmentiphaga aceris]QEI07578.1 secretion protein [Pigmentiphaga aceris]
MNRRCMLPCWFAMALVMFAHVMPAHAVPPAPPAFRMTEPIPPPVASASAATDEPDIDMLVGESQIVDAPDLGRVAVGNGRVLSAAPAEGKEVVLFAKQAGNSTLVIWQRDGRSRRIHVNVLPADTRRVQQELAAFLTRIPNARSTPVGDKLIIEGDDLSEIDRSRIATLAKRYPQIIDFTGQLGWESMISIDVKVVEIPRSKVQELGLRWDQTSTGGLTTGVAYEAGGRRLQSRPGESPLDAPFPSSGGPLGYFGLNALLQARLTAMAQAGDAVVLAEPKLSARSGSTARFQAGGEVPYATVDRNGASSTTFKPYGVTLGITPRVDQQGTVRSLIEIEVSSVDLSVAATSGPALKTRRTETEFNVRSGETLVLSGFLSREHAEDVDKVPGLSELPVLGALFRSRRYQLRETELVVFVTPVVVTPAHPDSAAPVTRANRALEQTFTEPLTLHGPANRDPFLLEPQ